MINENTPYKLAEIIRDTWPQLYYLKRDAIDNQQEFSTIKTVLRTSDSKGSQ
jgi:hypothetical protein